MIFFFIEKRRKLQKISDQNEKIRKFSEKMQDFVFKSQKF